MSDKFRVADTATDHEYVTNAIAEALTLLLAEQPETDLTAWLNANPARQWLTLNLCDFDGTILATQTVFSDNKS